MDSMDTIDVKTKVSISILDKCSILIEIKEMHIETIKL